MLIHNLKGKKKKIQPTRVNSDILRIFCILFCNVSFCSFFFFFEQTHNMLFKRSRTHLPKLHHEAVYLLEMLTRLQLLCKMLPGKLRHEEGVVSVSMCERVISRVGDRFTSAPASGEVRQLHTILSGVARWMTFRLFSFWNKTKTS